MMTRILTALSIAAILFFSQNAWAQQSTENNDILVHGDFEDMRKTDTSKVVEIINPLVVKLEDGRFIHLAGLDYPDLDYYNPGDLSVTAMKILDDFLKNKNVKIYQTPSPDKGRKNRLGHSIAHLVRSDDNVWVQGMLISLGVARTRTTTYTPEMASQMLSIEESARASKSGMWEIDKYKVLTPEQAKKHIGSYQIVEGRINSASMNKNRLYLNFGNNWREDFTVSISAFDLKSFTRKRIYPKDWNGKTIRVRGWIESYNGPYMEIDHPERFEALFEKAGIPSSPEQNTKNQAVEKKQKTTPSVTHQGTALPEYNN